MNKEQWTVRHRKITDCNGVAMMLKRFEGEHTTLEISDAFTIQDRAEAKELCDFIMKSFGKK